MVQDPALQRNFEAIQGKFPLGSADQAYPVVTSLPTTGTNGQVIYYLASDTDGVVWPFKYREASASTYKWEAVGDPTPLYNRNATGEATTTGATTEAGVNCRVTIPALAGDYISEGHGRAAVTAGVGTLAQYFLRSGSTDTLVGEHRDYGGTDSRANVGGIVKFTSVPASTVFSWAFGNGSGDGNTIGLNYQTLAVRPVRVG